MPVAAPRWRQAWPLWLLMILFATAALWVWRAWPQILLQSVLWQKALHQQMTALLQQVAANPHQAGLTLMGFSLLYGVLHALGPGHGKVVIATFLATHPTRIKTSLQLTLAAAIVQGGVAIALVTVMLVVLQLSSRQLHLSSWWLEKSSYLLVAALGGWLCWRALGRLRLALRPVDALAEGASAVNPSVNATSAASRVADGTPQMNEPAVTLARPTPMAAAVPAAGAAAAVSTGRPLSGKIASATLLPPAGNAEPAVNGGLALPAHQHSAHCGCGHQHLPDARQLAAAVGWKTKLVVVLSMGLRPCSGAIMMLLFSKVIGVYLWGVLSALVMAAGTALTVSAMALLVQVSRVLALRLSRNRPAAAWHQVALSCLALSGGILLVAIGAMLWFSAQPDISGGIRPLFR